MSGLCSGQLSTPRRVCHLAPHPQLAIWADDCGCVAACLQLMHTIKVPLHTDTTIAGLKALNHIHTHAHDCWVQLNTAPSCHDSGSSPQK